MDTRPNQVLTPPTFTLLFVDQLGLYHKQIKKNKNCTTLHKSLHTSNNKVMGPNNDQMDDQMDFDVQMDEDRRGKVLLKKVPAQVLQPTSQHTTTTTTNTTNTTKTTKTTNTTTASSGASSSGGSRAAQQIDEVLSFRTATENQRMDLLLALVGLSTRPLNSSLSARTESTSERTDLTAERTDVVANWNVEDVRDTHSAFEVLPQILYQHTYSGVSKQKNLQLKEETVVSRYYWYPSRLQAPNNSKSNSKSKKKKKRQNRLPKKKTAIGRLFIRYFTYTRRIN
jgi:hypothetical protein